MKKFLALVAALFVTTVAAFAADPAEGYWVSYDEKSGQATAGWHIWEENGSLVGEILSVAGLPQDVKATGGAGKKYKDFYNNADVGTLTSVGTKWIWGLKNKGSGKWSGGSIIDPNNGSKYACSVTFHAADGKKYKVDTLEMRGSIGPFGRSQYWKKSTQADASALR